MSKCHNIGFKDYFFNTIAYSCYIRVNSFYVKWIFVKYLYLQNKCFFLLTIRLLCIIKFLIKTPNLIAIKILSMFIKYLKK